MENNSFEELTKVLKVFKEKEGATSGLGLSKSMVGSYLTLDRYLQVFGAKITRGSCSSNVSSNCLTLFSSCLIIAFFFSMTADALNTALARNSSSFISDFPDT